MNFLAWFPKNTQVSNLMKIRPVGAELFHADGRTDITKLIVASRNFANAPKMWSIVFARTCQNKIMRSLSAWSYPLYQWLCNALCNQDAYCTSCRLHAKQPSRTSCGTTKALFVLSSTNVKLQTDGSTSSYNVDRLHNILSSLWTVLRNIHSVSHRLSAAQ